MVLQSFLYLLVPLNRTELTRLNYYEFFKSSTTPCRKKSPAPVNGLRQSVCVLALASLGTRQGYSRGGWKEVEISTVKFAESVFFVSSQQFSQHAL